MRISLKDFGGFLSSPELGKRIAVSVLDSIRKEPDNNVILDFSGVPGVNKHFCEEFLTLIFRGIGYEEFKKKVIMQNQTAVVKLIFDTVASQKKGITSEGINNVIGEPIHTVHIEKKEEVVQSVVETPKEEVVKEEERVEVVQNVEPAEDKKPQEEIKPEAKEEVKEAVSEEKIEEQKVEKKRGRKTKVEKRESKVSEKKTPKPKSTAKKIAGAKKKTEATPKKTTKSKKK